MFHWGRCSQCGRQLTLNVKELCIDCDPPIREVLERSVVQDKCPRCGGELDTGWECNDCCYDARPLVMGD